jgi:hypothetical protein
MDKERDIETIQRGTCAELPKMSSKPVLFIVV